MGPDPPKNIQDYHHQFLLVHIPLDTLLVSCLLHCSKDLQWPSRQRSLRLGSNPACGNGHNFTQNIGDIYQFSPKVVTTDTPLADPCQWDTMWCLYNAVNFHQNSHKMHPIAHPLGQDMGCNLWFDSLIQIMLQTTQCCMKHLVILDRIITTLHCM